MYILHLTLSLHCHQLIVFLRKSLIHGQVHVFNTKAFMHIHYSQVTQIKMTPVYKRSKLDGI